MAHNHSAESWDSHSAKWSSQTQSITRSPCVELWQMSTRLRPVSPDSVVFDNGAGSGMLTSIVVSTNPEVRVTAADVSPGMIDTLREETKKQGWQNVQSLVADASDLRAAGIEDSTFSHSVGTFFLPFVADPAKVMSEMARVTRKDGVVGVSTWSRISWVPCWETAVRKTVDADYVAPKMFHDKTTEEADVERLMKDAGLNQVEIKVFQCFHPQKESVEAAVEEFWEMGNPTVKLLKQDFTEEQLQKIKPAFSEDYAARHNGVKQRQFERTVLAVGTKRSI